MNDFENQNQTKQKSYWWIWVIVIILLLVIGGGGFWLWKNSSKPKPQASASTSPSPTKSSVVETWTRGDKMILPIVTSSDTHKLPDGYRMYYMKDGGIVYAVSKDGLNFAAPTTTGVTEDAGKFLSNPAVLDSR
jgi:cytoskeletal protein RodZ